VATALLGSSHIMSARQVFIAALILALATAGIGWFLANHERTTEKLYVGFQGRARTDPYLAAQRLLQRMGMNAQAVRTMTELRTLPPSATLVLPQARQSITPQLQQRILEWVGQGGHLIVEAEAIHQPDALLDTLGVHRTAVDVPDEEFDEDSDSEEDRPRASNIVEVGFPPDRAPVRVRMSQDLSVESEFAVASFGGPYATTLLFIERGGGLVTVATDLSSVSNYFIGELDHADFLWRLVQLDPDGGDVYFFNNPQRLSLVGWLRANAWAALAGASGLLLLWLWRIAPRFGPIQPDPERVRRRLLDHLRASGRFLWSNGGAVRLLEVARDACLRRVMRAHPDLMAIPDAQRKARIAQLLALTEEQAAALLAAPAATRMIDFLHAIRLYQEVHERLALRRSGTPPMTRR
jgi:hypothetical protein